MNMKTIAKLAGVSVSTVSKIIHNYPDVSEETKKNVLKIMEENGYRPNTSSKLTTIPKSQLIGVVFAGKLNVDFRHPYFIEVINAFKKQIGILGYDVILFSNEKFLSGGEDYLARCLHYQVDGCIIIAGDELEPSIGDLDRSDIPCIGVDIELHGRNSAYITTDNKKIASKVIEHFYLNGYRDIGYLGTDRRSGVMQIREEAFREALGSFAMPVREDWFVYSSGFEEEFGYEATKAWIARGSLPKALFAASDLLAFGALRAFREHHIAVPEDIAVIGCDDIEACQYITPTLTTIRQDKERIGRLAAMMLFDLMNKQTQGSAIMVEPELQIRASCGSQPLWQTNTPAAQSK